jgi:hypothetical protein
MVVTGFYHDRGNIDIEWHLQGMSWCRCHGECQEPNPVERDGLAEALLD